VNRPLERRIEAGRISGLLNTIYKYAISVNGAALNTYVQGKLTSDEFHNPSRSIAYNRIIGALLGHNSISLALRVYERMISEGLLPSLYTRVQMEAMAIVHSLKPRQEVYRSLKTVFAEESFDEASLEKLITTLEKGVKKMYPPETIDRIVKLFIKSQGPGYRPPARLVCRLVDLLVRNHSKQRAKEWLDIAKELNELDVGPPPPPSPHTAFLKALAKAEPTNVPAQIEILNRMQHDGILPDASSFNSLIATQISKGNLANAFTLYSALLQCRPDSALPQPKPTILPDSTTFHLIFKAIKLVGITRGVRARQHKRSQNAISARQLYGDMIESHLIHTRGRPKERSSAIDPLLLNLALRVFMKMFDYSAAFVVIRSLEIYNIPPNIETYQIVIKSLLQRMHYQLGSARGVKERRWVDVLLGIKETDDPPLGMNTDMVVQLMQFGFDNRITLDEVPDIEKLDDADEMLSRMPSLSLIMGQEILTENVAYSCIPLLRIIRRALIAQATHSLKVSTANMSLAQLVSTIIVQTKQSMLRDVPAWVKRVNPSHGDARTSASR